MAKIQYKVTTPVENFSGEVAGVAFVKGAYTGELAPEALAYFQRQGYEVEKVRGKKAGDAVSRSTPPGKSASKREWLEYAVANGMDPAEADKLTRDDLVAKFAPATDPVNDQVTDPDADPDKTPDEGDQQ